MNHDEFKRLVVQRGEELYRDMPWRNDTRPYYILVSELMLQQTQVHRVIPKFESFIATFPNVEALAGASLADVLRCWQGLGYNRRAKFLHEAAKIIAKEGAFPEKEEELLRLPGVGKNTTGAILAYAYNQPAIFIETNVRAVYIHHFFNDQDLVDDKEIYRIMEKTVPSSPRTFYWALMDYGSWLKRQGIRPGRSVHYKKQAPLKGSIREVRGQILKALTAGRMKESKLQDVLNADDRFKKALEGLVKDGLVTNMNGELHLTK